MPFTRPREQLDLQRGMSWRRAFRGRNVDTVIQAETAAAPELQKGPERCCALQDVEKSMSRQPGVCSGELGAAGTPGREGQKSYIGFSVLEGTGDMRGTF